VDGGHFFVSACFAWSAVIPFGFVSGFEFTRVLLVPKSIQPPVQPLRSYGTGHDLLRGSGGNPKSEIRNKSKGPKPEEAIG